jgi:hypothetical protein
MRPHKGDIIHYQLATLYRLNRKPSTTFKACVDVNTSIGVFLKRDAVAVTKRRNSEYLNTWRGKSVAARCWLKPWQLGQLTNQKRVS